MFDARDLLGRLLQSGLSGSANERVGHAMGPSGLGQGGNPLSDIFSQISGLARGGQGQGQGGLGQGGLGQGGLGGLASMAESMFGQATGAVRSGNPLAVGGLAALAGALLGGGGSAARGAVGGGLLAVLGSLAYSALQSRGQAAAPGTTTPAIQPPVGLCEPSTPEEERAVDELAGLVIRAMINAAKADGQIDPAEKQRILGKLAEDGADAEAQAYVEAEMQKPLDSASLVQAVGGRADLAIQVYAASLLAIEVDTPAEEDYLRNLAAALGLDAGTVSQVHKALGVSRGAAAVSPV